MPNGEEQNGGAGVDRRLTIARADESGQVFMI